ncbi:MAG: phrB, partial [Verrucomicrobiaceae bacterium]|nr:phrB [Verrucomicrobiaceae bacterium]
APVKAEFLWRNLAELRESLSKINIPLTVRCVPRFSDIESDLLALTKKLKCAAVFANREYAVNELRRDTTIKNKLTEENIRWRVFDDATLLPPGMVRTQQGQPFKVFTPFKRAVLELIGDGAIGCLPIKRKAEEWFVAPKLPRYPYLKSAIDPGLWPAGEKAATHLLQEFIDNRIGAYKTQRDIPLLNGTSKLSPYLVAGVISVRRCVEAALMVNSGQWGGGDEGVSTWLNELIWRDFYTHVLAQFPRVSMHRPMRAETEAVAWRHDKKEFNTWCEGKTGFPLVDAAMRQLNATGWMHNRLRMVTAMFLSKYLLIDWRLGEKYFMQHLIDGDLAANNGGWQWSASTGTDAAPYFRLLSPVRQMERFDADARFCKKFLPELIDVSPKSIAQLGHPDLLQAGYPPPLVDVKFARSRALQAFAQAKIDYVEAQERESCLEA